MNLFHLAYHVDDLDAARSFYSGVLKCEEGRSTDSWIDYNFFGHQISLHLGPVFQTTNSGKVGARMVPMPHLGVILPADQWHQLAEQLTTAGIDFTIAPTTRFEGTPGEQHTMFFHDPAGNPIEIKGFTDMTKVFAA